MDSDEDDRQLIGKGNFGKVYLTKDKSGKFIV